MLPAYYGGFNSEEPNQRGMQGRCGAGVHRASMLTLDKLSSQDLDMVNNLEFILECFVAGSDELA